VSYTSREDEIRQLKPILDQYIGALQGIGVRVCPVYYDGWYLRDRSYSDAELAGRLREAIGMSAFTVAFLSPGYLDSQWCCFEWMSTREEHAHRAHPAPKYSILPMLWKASSSTAMRRVCDDIQRTKVLDITDGIGPGHAVQETKEYLDQWFPDEGWLPAERGASLIA
jgi:hypothetical protein